MPMFPVTSEIQKVQFKIQGMTSESCEVYILHKIKKIN